MHTQVNMDLNDQSTFKKGSRACVMSESPGGPSLLQMFINKGPCTSIKSTD